MSVLSFLMPCAMQQRYHRNLVLHLIRQWLHYQCSGLNNSYEMNNSNSKPFAIVVLVTINSRNRLLAHPFAFWLSGLGGLLLGSNFFVCRVAREYKLVAEIQNIQTDDSGPPCSSHSCSVNIQSRSRHTAANCWRIQPSLITLQ